MGRRFWVGVGTKFGGTLAVVGGDTFLAPVMGISEDNRFIVRYVQVDSLRLGVGLGGAIGTSVFISNVDTLDALDGTVSKLSDAKDMTDVISGLNVAFAIPGVKLKYQKQMATILLPIISEFGNMEKFCLAVAKYASKSIDVSKLRDAISSAVSTTLTASNLPTDRDFTLVIDLPGAGVGAEVGLYTTISETTVRRFPNVGLGRYEVSVPSKEWYWNIFVESENRARWIDRHNPGQSGRGSWQTVDNKVLINWEGELQGWDVFPSAYQGKNLYLKGKTRTGGVEYETQVRHFAS